MLDSTIMRSRLRPAGRWALSVPPSLARANGWSRLTERRKRGTMWHAADGDLHAYLDGALDFYPSGDAQRIREHLESCSECKRRLEEERAIVARAREVLAASGPAQPVAPPFEELKRRADGPPRTVERPRRFAGERLAWAATVVMALGIGWRIGVQPPAERSFEAERDVPPSEAPALDPLAADAAQRVASPEAAAAPTSPTAEVGTGAGAPSFETRQMRTVTEQTIPATGTMADAASGAGAASSARPVAREEGARGGAPAANFQFRASDFAAGGVRGGAAGLPQAGSPAGPPPAASPPPPAAPPSEPLPAPGAPASPLAGRALNLDEIVVTGTAGAARRREV